MDRIDHLEKRVADLVGIIRLQQTMLQGLAGIMDTTEKLVRDNVRMTTSLLKPGKN